ncbi:MAG TPA: hypothetical protein VFA95_11335 [Gammaproteobacteria bacterium]|nr:hypothetical protein [Gammaproteobacteria bacterium]
MPGGWWRRIERVIGALLYILAALSVLYSMGMITWFLADKGG